jgi:cell division protein FtsL
MLSVPDFKIEKKENNFNLIGRIRLQILVTAAVMATALFFTQLVFANKLATDGEKLSQIEKKINALEEENGTLRLNITKESSLATISKKASNLGFEKPSQVIVPQSLLH